MLAKLLDTVGAGDLINIAIDINEHLCYSSIQTLRLYPNMLRSVILIYLPQIDVQANWVACSYVVHPINTR